MATHSSFAKKGRRTLQLTSCQGRKMTNPSTDPIVSARYIAIGEMLNALQYEAGNKFGWVASHLSGLMTTLDHVGLPYPKKSLEQFHKSVLQLEESANADQLKVGLPAEMATDLRKLIATAHEIIAGAAEARRTIALDLGGVSAKLRGLSHQLGNLDDAQTSLLNEAIRCLECGSYRSAAIMGWNLAFDYIRRWVFDRHLSPFNAALSAYQNKKTLKRIYGDIKDYTDFLSSDAPGERTFLDTCNSAQIIVGNVYDALKGYLRDRNAYAHPSGKEPTPIQVNAYLEYLADILEAKPFN
jgi:hypothetical protein